MIADVRLVQRVDDQRGVQAAIGVNGFSLPPRAVVGRIAEFIGAFGAVADVRPARLVQVDRCALPGMTLLAVYDLDLPASLRQG